MDTATVIRIWEQSKVDGNFQAAVSFNHGPEYAITIRDPFEEKQEAELEWYFEEHLRFPFTNQVRAKEAAASIAAYGEALFAHVFRDNPDIYAEYKTLLKTGLERTRIEIEGEPEFHALHWEALKDPALRNPLSLQAIIVRQNKQPAPIAADPQPFPTINLLIVTARPYGGHDVGYRTISRPLVEALRQANLRVNVTILRPGVNYGEKRQQNCGLKNSTSVVSSTVSNQNCGGKRMLHFMERSTIYYLRQKGWTKVQIAEFTGHHRDTIARVLREDVEKELKTRQRSSVVAVYDEQITAWLKQKLSVRRMLEMARADATHPSRGGETAFYDYVRKLRRANQQSPHHLALRFEGVPGEFLQIDWGEMRDMAFTKEGMAGQTRYFFAARLKYSRYMYVSFHTDMREETLLRCLIGCFTDIDGVPWAVVTDHMKTAVLGRDEQHQPVWNPAYQKLAAEFTFHPDVCAPASGNQKGAVENLVKYVKGNFLAGRSFYDDADLAEQCQQWLRQVNTERPSDATGAPPAVLLAQEQLHFGPLPACAADYGFFDCVVVSREGLVGIETNRYSVPAHLLGRTLTARIHASRIEVFADGERVASHVRHPGSHARIIDPAHFEAAFATKPRGRVMVYRDWLCTLSPTVSGYVAELCHKRRDELSQTPTEVLAGLKGGNVSLDTDDSNQEGKDIFTLKTESILRCIDYSHSNLSPEAQHLLLCLAPFTSILDMGALPVYTDLLKQQAALHDISVDRWHDVLQEAANWGLLSPDAAIRRFLHLQPTLSYFLRSRLAIPEQSKVRDAINVAFRELYKQIGYSLSNLLQSKDPQERQIGLFVTRLEYENLVTALHLALAAQESIAGPIDALMLYLDSTQNQRRGLEIFQAAEKQFATYPKEKLAGSLTVEYINLVGTIANWQLDLKQYEQAKVSYQRLLAQLEHLAGLDEKRKKNLQASTYHNLGRVAQEQRQWPQAEDYYQKALAIYVEFNDRYSQASTYHQLGRVAQEQRQWPLARDYLLLALEIFVAYKESYNAAIALRTLARLRKESGDASVLRIVAEKLGVTVSEAETLLRKMGGDEDKEEQ